MSEREPEEVGAHPPQEADALPFARLTTVLGGALVIMCGLALWAFATWRGMSHDLRPDGMRFERTLGGARERQGVEEGIFTLTAPADELRRRQEQGLERFGWVDRAHGIVRIPIEDAIEMASESAP